MKASDKAYEALRADILAWRLRPGTSLSETELAIQLEVSRTPVREALSRLAADGLVRSSGRFAVVSELSASTLVELFEYREAVEAKAAQLAARHNDRRTFEELAASFATADELLSNSDVEHEQYYELVTRFDAAIDAAVENLYVLNALRSLRTHLARARRFSKDNIRRLAQAATEHLLIAESIADGDEAMAVHATSVHLRASLKYILSTTSPARRPEPAHPIPTGEPVRIGKTS